MRHERTFNIKPAPVSRLRGAKQPSSFAQLRTLYLKCTLGALYGDKSNFVLAMHNMRNNFTIPNFQATKDTLVRFGILRIHSYLYLVLVDVKHLLKDICSAKVKGGSEPFAVWPYLESAITSITSYTGTIGRF